MQKSTSPLHYNMDNIIIWSIYCMVIEYTLSMITKVMFSETTDHLVIETESTRHLENCF